MCAPHTSTNKLFQEERTNNHALRRSISTWLCASSNPSMCSVSRFTHLDSLVERPVCQQPRGNARRHGKHRNEPRPFRLGATAVGVHPHQNRHQTQEHKQDAHPVEGLHLPSRTPESAPAVVEWVAAVVQGQGSSARRRSQSAQSSKKGLQYTTVEPRKSNPKSADSREGKIVCTTVLHGVNY